MKFLLSDPRVNPGDSHNDGISIIKDNWIGIKWASQFNHPDIVQLLLSDPRVDPTVMNNYGTRIFCHSQLTALTSAAESGHIEVVRILLQDPRVNAADDNYLGLHVESIHLLA